MYFFYILEMTGFILIRTDTVTIITLIIVTVMAVYRIEAEEKFLCRKFKKDYEEYKSNTKKLIPFIY